MGRCGEEEGPYLARWMVKERDEMRVMERDTGEADETSDDALLLSHSHSTASASPRHLELQQAAPGLDKKGSSLGRSQAHRQRTWNAH